MVVEELLEGRQRFGLLAGCVVAELQSDHVTEDILQSVVHVLEQLAQAQSYLWIRRLEFTAATNGKGSRELSNVDLCCSRVYGKRSKLNWS